MIGIIKFIIHYLQEKFTNAYLESAIDDETAVIANKMVYKYPFQFGSEPSTKLIIRPNIWGLVNWSKE